MKTYVFCQTRFAALHHWPHAPHSVDYLRHPHRHEFHVRVSVEVKGDDREVEFITLKKQVDDAIANIPNGNTITWSCEQWAKAIKKAIGASLVEVSEDGENGAVVFD